ncbi:MAG: macro domain-containing protein [Lachnospiraceae bacterium]|nr:macro domain-containing protein [Lachnospiraceae bacterium]
MPFQIVRNDLTKMNVDAIVNTANPSPTYGSGLDKAVYEAAGMEQLLAKRKKIGEAKRGTSFITDGYNLPAKYIIHTIGIPWVDGKNDEEVIIRECYRSTFKLAVENKIKSLALPLLATGNYGFPKELALKIATSEIQDFLSEQDIELYLVVFDDESFSLSKEKYGDIDSYINDNYVEAKSVLEYYEDIEESDIAEDVTEGSDSEREERGRKRLFSSRNKKENRKRIQETGSADSIEEQKLYENDPSLARYHRASSMLADFSEKTGRADETRALREEVFGEAMEESRPKKSSPAMNFISVKSGESAPRSLDDVISNLDKTFMEMVFTFADNKGISDVEVQKRANLDRKAFSKLKCGTSKKPSKNTALAIAVALELNLDETKDLLARAGYALSPCSKQDLIVQYFIEKEVYDIYEINYALFEHDEAELGAKA